MEHVSAVDQDVAEASVAFHGLKLPGTGIPGVVTAGSFLCLNPSLTEFPSQS